MLKPRPTLSLLTVVLSLIRSALELQNVHSLAGPFNCNRVRTPSPEDNLIVGVCFIPIDYLVIILFLAGVTVLRALFICPYTLKELFCFSFYVFPRKDVANLCLCPQLLQLPPNELEISFCLAMH